MNRRIDCLKLKKLRNKIDMIDKKILQLISLRMTLIKEIGQYKLANHLEVVDKQRWNKVKSKLIIEVQSLGIAPEVILKIYKIIHQYSCKLQRVIHHEES